MDQVELLFVNKNATSGSLSRSHTTEKASINRHVQRGRKHERQVRIDLNLSVRPRLGFVFRHRTDVGDPSKSSNQETEPVQGLELAPSNDVTHLESDTAIVEDEVACETRSVGRQQETFVGMTCERGTSVVPFNLQGVKQNPQFCSLLKYYLQEWQLPRWQSESGARSEGTEVFRRAAEMVRGCLQSDMTMYTTLAAIAGLRINQEGAALQYDVSLYIHKAIIATQQHLADSPVIDDQLIISIFHLSCAEWLAFKSEAAHVHLKFVKALVDHLGGWKNLKGQLMEIIILGDGYFAAETLTLPVFPCDFDRGRDPGIVAWMSATNPVRLGEGLLSPLQVEIVPENLRSVIADLADCVCVSVAHADKPNPPQETLHWVLIRNLALRHRLLIMIADDPRIYALRVALTIWMILVLYVSERKRVVNIMASKLQKVVRGIEKEHWNGHEAVLMWILTVGAMSTVNDGVEQKGYIKEIADLTGAGRVEFSHEPPSEQDLVSFSESFFYLDAVQRPMLQRLTRSIGESATRKSIPTN